MAWMVFSQPSTAALAAATAAVATASSCAGSSTETHHAAR
jgi:hypothetical protein